MENNLLPDPNVIFPVPNIKTVKYIKPTIKNKNIIVGDFTYFDFTYFGDVDFEKHVTHFYDFCNDKLIIGKFCQIASGVEFIMNGANHKMDCISTFPFYIFEKWNENVPSQDVMPQKGDTIIGNDVWIGQNVTILPGIKVGDGAIIGTKSVVGKNVEPYSIVVGNPAKIIRKRFDDELIELLLKLKWWDLPIERINEMIPLLHDNNLEYVKEKLIEMKL
jgi:virginiamycin A acetyltransferase